MRIGIIGLGSIGKRHAANAREMGHQVASYDLRGGTFGSLAQMCMVRLDAVMICTPAATHLNVAEQLYVAGYRGPLFVEKPLALSVEECAIFREWPHPTTMTGYMLRFHPELQRIRAEVPNADRGGFYCDCDSREWPGTYGPMLLECSHELDLALFCGAPAKIESVSKYQDQAADIWLGHESEGPLWLFSYDARSDQYCRLWMLGKEGMPIADVNRGRVRFGSPEALGTDMYRAELAHFLECVQNNTPTITPFADGIRVVEICTEAMKMAGATTT